jgi:hypothetical protein
MALSNTFKDRDLEKHALAIDEQRGRVRRITAKSILTIGAELEAGRIHLSGHGDGVFGAWCEERLDIKRTTAWRMISVHQTFGDCSKLAQSIEPSALYLLASNKTPKPVLEEALALAKTGKTICHKQAKWMVDRHYTGKFLDNCKADGEEPPKKKKKKPMPPIGRPIETESSDLTRLKRAWEQANRDDRRKFLLWIEDRKVKTTLDAETGKRLVKAK